MLYREPKLLKDHSVTAALMFHLVSVLYREPKLLKEIDKIVSTSSHAVSVLYREPKLLKEDWRADINVVIRDGFSALP